MYRISKAFAFSASHRLGHLPDGHPCARLHGHNYAVEVDLESALLNGDSFVRDYGELRALQDFIDNTLDHRHLCGVIDTEAGPIFICANTPQQVVEIEARQLVVDKGAANVLQPATAENIARALFFLCRMRWPETTAVRVAETPKTVAEFRL